MSVGPVITGVGMTPMNRRDLGPEELARWAAADALRDAEIGPGQVAMVLAANATGGRLCDQGCIRGQSWLRGLGLGGAPIVNVDNSCGGGAAALHLAVLAASAGESPVLVVGVEKMWTGDRAATLAGVEDGLPATDRAALRAAAGDGSGSLLMGLNAQWVEHQLTERGTTIEQVAATVVKARRCAMRNPLAQTRTPLTVEEVLEAPAVAGRLTRPMCSSFTDGAAAVVVSATAVRGAPRVRSSTTRSGDGELEYHERLREVADQGWKASGIGPGDVDVAEIHDATSAEELYALESLGFYGPGEAGTATAAGDTDLGGNGVCVNPSGGLVARGHPLGATGIAQVVELALQLRGHAGARQVPKARLAIAVNAGGIIAGDTAFAALHVLERGRKAPR